MTGPCGAGSRQKPHQIEEVWLATLEEVRHIESTKATDANYFANLGYATIFVFVPGDDIKLDPERENRAVLTIAAQTANSIHIRITFNAVTRYKVGK